MQIPNFRLIRKASHWSNVTTAQLSISVIQAIGIEQLALLIPHSSPYSLFSGIAQQATSVRDQRLAFLLQRTW